VTIVTDRLVDAQRPWPGPAAFGELDRDFFFGRDVEVEELFGLVLAHRLTVLYGLSGLGKTSLINAGLFPLLRARDFLPIRIRIDVEPGALSPSSQINAAISADCLSWNVDVMPSTPGETAWQYLHRNDVEFWSQRHRLLTPVLIFDQFEEIFSRVSDPGGLDIRVGTIEILGDLTEGRVPTALKADLERTQELAGRYNFPDHRYRLLIAIREDYLPDLDELGSDIPSLRQSRARLTHMRSGTATAALLSAAAPGGLLTNEVASEIVRFVGESIATSRGRFSRADLPIEPALLSVVCRELNEERIRDARAHITLNQLDHSEAILERFYEDGVRESPEPLRRFVEDRLINAEGLREMVAFQTMAAVHGVREEDIFRLIDKRILRIEYREGGRRLLELTHDRLAPVVRDSRDIRIREEEARQQAELLRKAVLTPKEDEQSAVDELRQLGLLLDGLRALGSGRVLDDVLALVLDSAITITGAERGVILLVDRDRKLDAKLGRGQGKLPLSMQFFDMDRAVSEKAFESGQPVIETGRHISVKSRDVKWIVALPLRLVHYVERADQRGPEEIIGVLYLDASGDRDAISYAAVKSLETLTAEAAIAIENARLYRQALDKARVEQELAVAAAMQQSLLPNSTRQGSFFTIAAASIACRTVGGDFFDYVDLASGAFGFIVGDVAGKGPPAALLAATTLGMFAVESMHADQPAELMSRLNRYIFSRAIESRFLTAFYATLTPTGVLTCANGGHNAPLLISRSETSRLEPAGMVLGIFEQADFEQTQVQMRLGDLVVAFSDGVTEALSDNGEEFGEERLQRLVQESAGSPQALVDRVISALRAFQNGAAQSDDVTVVVLRYDGDLRSAFIRHR
jgi:serine phosphatase RsbU (regulator of sigma subunit)